MREDRPSSAGRRLLVAFCTVVILLIVTGVPAAILAPVPAARASVVAEAQRVLAPAKPRFPSFGDSAITVVGMKDVLATSGSQSPRPIASITKVITALVVLQKKPLTVKDDGPTITFTSRDVTYLQQVLDDDGSWAPVQAGWKLSERRTIETMLLPSANNYAESLAVWAYGSVPSFLTAARAYLAAHGLAHTSLVDSNGLDSGDRSTPTDLVHLGELALADPVLAGIVSEPTATEPEVGPLTNTNALLGTDGVDGIKTGTTDDAGACLLFSAKATIGSRKVRIVGVVLDAPTHPAIDAAVPVLLDSVKRGLHDVTLATAKQSFGTYHTRWGTTARAVAAKGASMLVWGTAKVVRRTDVHEIRGGTKGERVGTVTYEVGDQRAVVRLVLDRNVLAAPVWWRLTHPLR